MLEKIDRVPGYAIAFLLDESASFPLRVKVPMVVEQFRDGHRFPNVDTSLVKTLDEHLGWTSEQRVDSAVRRLYREQCARSSRCNGETDVRNEVVKMFKLLDVTLGWDSVCISAAKCSESCEVL